MAALLRPLLRSQKIFPLRSVTAIWSRSQQTNNLSTLLFVQKRGMTDSAPQTAEFFNDTLTDGGPNAYNQWASKYESIFNSLDWNRSAINSLCIKWQSYHTSQSLALSLQKSGKKHRILDAGCGTGFVGEFLFGEKQYATSEQVEIYGGDLSPKMLEIAKSKNIYSDLRVINLKTELPYEADSFDSIVCCGVFLIGHCGPESLPNLIRVLKPNCYLVFTVREQQYSDKGLGWKKQMEKHLKDYNCELLEDNVMPYHTLAKGVVAVIQKKQASTAMN